MTKYLSTQKPVLTANERSSVAKNQIIAGVLLIQNGQYVAQRRDNIPNIAEPGMLVPWGGAAEGDEGPRVAAVRELKEETGVVTAPDQLKLLVEQTTLGRSPEFIGRQTDVYIFSLELEPEAEIQCFEGDAAVRFDSLDQVIQNGEKPNDFLIKAVKEYESKA